MRLIVLVFSLLLLPLFSAQATPPLKVLAFHPILAELAKELGGTSVQVDCPLPLGADPHTFSPSPVELRLLTEADLVLASGFGLEPYLERLFRNTPSKARRFQASEHIATPLPSCAHETHADREGHDHGEYDPHWWHGLSEVQSVAQALAQALCTLRPTEREAIQSRLEAHKRRLYDLKQWAEACFAKIPLPRRHLVTSHDAFAYLARDYHLHLHPLHGISPDTEPDARALARLIDQIRSMQIRVVFSDNTENPRFFEAMLRESGAHLGGQLLADGPAASADTFEAMYRHNIETLTKALSGG